MADKGNSSGFGKKFRKVFGTVALCLIGVVILAYGAASFLATGTINLDVATMMNNGTFKTWFMLIGGVTLVFALIALSNHKFNTDSGKAKVETKGFAITKASVQTAPVPSVVVSPYATSPVKSAH